MSHLSDADAYAAWPCTTATTAEVEAMLRERSFGKMFGKTAKDAAQLAKNKAAAGHASSPLNQRVLGSSPRRGNP